jgi:RNA polymerase sigma factor (sigma-70 family)
LYDDFFNETCKRSLLIVKTVTSDSTLEAYLRKIATTSILNVLKSEGRLRRTKAGYSPVQTVSLDLDYSKTEVKYEPVDIQDTPEDLIMKKEILQNIVDAVYKVNQSAPEKEYLKLYKLRYKNGLTQQEIAEELGLSQSEVSKRLFKLMDKIKQAFGN